MAALHEHPFSIDIKPCRATPGHFVWSIHERRQPRRRSRQSYSSFDEARSAAQAMLRHLVFEWQLVGG